MLFYGGFSNDCVAVFDLPKLFFFVINTTSSYVLWCPLLYVILWLSRFWKKEPTKAKPFLAISSIRAWPSRFQVPHPSWFQVPHPYLPICSSSPGSVSPIWILQYPGIAVFPTRPFLSVSPMHLWTPVSLPPSFPSVAHSTHQVFSDHSPCHDDSPIPSFKSDDLLTDLFWYYNADSTTSPISTRM